MDKGKSKAFYRQVLLQRLRTSLKVAAIPALFVAIFALYFWDKQNAEQITVEGVVESWTRTQTELGAGDYRLRVVLSDGTPANATASRAGPAPVVGARIELLRTQTPSGLVSYRWVRQPAGK